MKASDPPEEALSIEEKAELCQQRIGYRFTNPSLVISALTHASVATSRNHSNERMEFLGVRYWAWLSARKYFASIRNILKGI